jgi:hypothetical protein
MDHETNQNPLHQAQSYAARWPGQVADIVTGLANQWAFSPDFLAAAPATVFANFAMTGSRATDRANAGGVPGDGTNFHHTFSYNAANNTCGAQLVGAGFHMRTCPHKGAVWQWDQQPGNAPYRLVREEEAASAKPLYAPQQYTQADIDKFNQLHHCTLSPKMVAVYTAKDSRPAAYRTETGETILMESIPYLFPPQDPNYVSVDEAADLIPFPSTTLPNGDPIGGTDVIRFWFLAGEDGCGNFLLEEQTTQTLYFYDHELDQLFRVIESASQK